MMVALLKRFAPFLLLANAALAQSYSTLIPFSNMRVGTNYWYMAVHTIENDTTAYCINRDVESNVTPTWDQQIVRVDNAFTNPTPTLLVSHEQWVAFTGINPATQGNMLPGARMRVIGDYLQFLDQNTDQIYRVHKTTGAISVFVSKAQILALTGGINVFLLEDCDFGPDNRMAFYDQTSKHLIEVDVNGNLSILISQTQMANFYTSLGSTVPVNGVSGGMAYDSNGNLYWALSNTGSTSGSAGGCIYKRDVATGVMSRVLTQLEIQLASNSFGNAAFNDIIVAPDCRVYLINRESGARAILSFALDNPSATLAMYLDQTTLSSGDMNTFPAFIGELNYYKNNLNFSSGGLSAISSSVYTKRLAGIPAVRADFNADGPVNQLDIDLMKGCQTRASVLYDPEHLPVACTLTPDCRGYLPADLDQDGDVDGDDFGMLQRCYGPTPVAGCAD